MAARSLMFQSVFPTLDTSSTPTPQATPLLAQESFDHGRAHESSLNSGLNDPSSESVQWERSWHAATAFFFEQIEARAPSQPCPSHVKAAISYLRSPDSVGWKLRSNSKDDDLVLWYSQTMQRSFIQRHVPLLEKLSEHLDDTARSWDYYYDRLMDARRILIGPFESFILPLLGSSAEASLAMIRSSYGALIAQLLSEQVLEPLQQLLISQANMALDDESPCGHDYADSMEGLQKSFDTKAMSQMQEILSTLMEGGFPGAFLERSLVQTFNQALKAHVQRSCAHRWEQSSTTVLKLLDWVSSTFAGLVAVCLKQVRLHDNDTKTARSELSETDLQAWKQAAVRQLSLLRLRELFDIIVDWDNGSRGGIDDLKEYATTPQNRQHLVNHFINVLSYRLLHPGASTDQILEIYIRVMRAFAFLDPHLVLLSRVSRPIRRYLRERDDTVKIIIKGLLSDPDNPTSSSDALGELAVELHQLDEVDQIEDDDGWNWDDMSWVPNPADAEIDYRSSKRLDIIGNLLSMFDAKDALVREFQSVLGERLLSPESDFSREIRVLELLKSRLGEASLQGCEVMIKDIFDSGRTDLLIKKERERNFAETSELFHTKILSRFFWPSLRDDNFRLPPAIQTACDRFSQGFEEHKTQRKLSWLPSLGQVTVELQLEDREINELVTTWQASVIYAFHEADNATGSPELSSTQIAEKLEMDEDLVENALAFWVSKLVLYERSPKLYRVLERIPTDEAAESAANEQEASASIVAAAHSASAAAAANAASAIRSEQELAEAKMEVLWQYVVGMLTNQGPMPLQQMVMMLNFVVPGGFTHPHEDLKSYLQRKVDEGQLQMAGPNYKMPKK